MNHDNDFIAIVSETTREAFIKRYPHPFLIVRDSSQSTNRATSFRTGTISRDAFNAQFTETTKKNPDPGQLKAFPVVKSRFSPWRSRITVGRARNNDVVIQEDEISKVHAYFERSSTGKSYSIVDAGSTNGTTVSGQRIEPGQKARLPFGAKITMGAFELQFLDSGGLYDMLMAEHS